MERLKALIDSGVVPFILATGAHNKINITRFVEAILIAALTMYGTVEVMKNELKHMNKANERIEAKMDKWYETTNDRINGIYKDFYNHDHSN